MIKVDTSQAIAALKGCEKQLPFALALAMTRTSKAAQRSVQELLPTHFRIRRPWTAKGIRITPISKSDIKSGRASVKVYTLDPYMRQQALGATRQTGGEGASSTAQTGTASKLRAVPGRWLGRTIRRSQWPDRLLRNRKLWRIAKLPSGVLAVVRARPKKGQTKTGPAWILVPSVNIAPRWPFEAEVEAAVQANWQRECEAAVAQAIATATR